MVDLPAGSSIYYMITATILSSATGLLSNTTTATAGPGETNTNPASVGGVTTSTDADLIVPTAELKVSVADLDGGSSVAGLMGSATPGTSINYVIRVQNSGPSGATGVQVVDPLASNPDFTSVSYTCTLGQIANN